MSLLSGRKEPHPHACKTQIGRKEGGGYNSFRFVGIIRVARPSLSRWTSHCLDYTRVEAAGNQGFLQSM
jgi:hypothetical protein